MTRSKIEAFFREFPFLVNLVSQAKVEEVEVLRISPDFLLTKRPVYPSGPFVDYLGSGRIILLNDFGQMIVEVGFRPRYRNQQFRWWRMSLWGHRWLNHKPSNEAIAELVCVSPNETVGEAINDLTSADRARVHYALLLETTNSSGNRNLTLFKPPKDFTIQGWVEEQIRREQEAIKEEVEEINQEAKTAVA